MAHDRKTDRRLAKIIMTAKERAAEILTNVFNEHYKKSTAFNDVTEESLAERIAAVYLFEAVRGIKKDMEAEHGKKLH